MNSAPTLSPELLQQITQIVLKEIATNSRLLTKNTAILLWKSKSTPNSFNLKIAKERRVGLIRTDRKGQTYWKFKWAVKPSPTEPNLALSEEPK